MARSKTVKNIAIYSVMAIFQKGISFFLVPLYTILLSPQEFGLVNQIIAITSFFILLFNFALDEAAVRLYFPLRKYKARSKKVLGTIVLTSIFIFFVKEISLSLIILSVLIIGSSPLFVIYQKLLRIQEKAKHYTFLSLFFTLIQIGLSVFFIVVLDLNALGYLLAITITNLIFFVVSLGYLKNEIYWQIDVQILKNALRYGLKIIPHSLSGWFSKGFTIITIGQISGSFLVGVFNAMNFLSIIINVMAKAVMDAFQPWIYTKLEEPETNKNLLFEVSKFMGLIVVLAGFFLSLFSAELIKTFINNSYHTEFHIVPILLYSAIILFIGSLLVYVLYYDKSKTYLIGVSSFIGAIINVILCLWLIPKFSLLGAALSVSIANTITAVVKQYYASKVLRSNNYLLDLYLFAIMNAFIAYFSMESDLGVRICYFVFEVVVIYLLYRTLLHSFILKLRA